MILPRYDCMHGVLLGSSCFDCSAVPVLLLLTLREPSVPYHGNILVPACPLCSPKIVSP